MRKSESAQKPQDTLQNYFASLLHEEPQVVGDELVTGQPLNRLLDKVSEYQQTEVAEEVAAQQEVVAEVVETIEIVEQIKPAEPDASQQIVTNEPYTEAFEALYFDVAGLTMAVRLEELGGIHRLDLKQVNTIPGRPKWFKGLVPMKERQLRIIDSAMWVMPEKYTKSLADFADYQYLIMLKDSSWGLACHKLDSTRTIPVDGVRWRQNAGKRPWLKGMVIDEMCALLNVEQMIELFEKGLNS